MPANSSNFHDSVHSEGVDQKLSFVGGGTFHTLYLELTNQCNLQCVHCYARSGPYEPRSFGFSYEDWVAVIDESKTLGCQRLQFIGGEPFLYKPLHRLVSHAREVGFSTIEIYTNGTRLTNADIDFIKKNEVQLAFSFYSDKVGDHDAVTQVEGSHARTLGAIRRAVAAGLHVRVSVIRMAENQSSAVDAIKLLRSIGVKHIGAEDMRGLRRGDEPVEGVDPFDQLCSNCTNGNLAINSAGEISPCVFSRFAKVGKFEDGISAALDSPELRSFRTKHGQLMERRGLRNDAFGGRNASAVGPGCCHPSTGGGGCCEAMPMAMDEISSTF